MEIDHKLIEAKGVADVIAKNSLVEGNVKSIKITCDYFSSHSSDAIIFVILDHIESTKEKLEQELKLQAEYLPFEIKLFTEEEFNQSYYPSIATEIWSE